MAYFSPKTISAVIHGALWAILTFVSALIAATSALHVLGLTMLPADPMVFLSAAAILLTRGMVDHRAEVSRPGSLGCPSASATLEAGFASLIHRTLAILTLGLSHALRTRRRGNR